MFFLKVEGCNDYHILNDPKRSTSVGWYENWIWYCDNLAPIPQNSVVSPDWLGPGWYRMLQPAGIKVS